MKRKGILIGVLAILAAGIIVWAGYRAVNGAVLGVKETVKGVYYSARSVLDHQAVIANNGKKKNILFVHHSVGHNLLAQGGLRGEFQKAGYDLWDQDYVYYGLAGPDGKSTGYSYDIPNDNTDIGEYAVIFQQPVYGLPVNALSAFLQHEVIVFKSCFPNSAIESDQALEDIKQTYSTIRNRILQFPDHLFILLTTPPLNPAETNAAAAGRARKLAQWLVSQDFLKGASNLKVFDLFDQLAESNPNQLDANMLKLDSRDGGDSHPNQAANLKVSPILAEFVIQETEKFPGKKP